jgi:hypothetical protein
LKNPFPITTTPNERRMMKPNQLVLCLASLLT